ncbi:MAG: copper chaperone PCu(A)C [Chloroflexi bacterium]|nr:copper chaperone PCu(A)C [Chloroflexota bacterium]
MTGAQQRRSTLLVLILLCLPACRQQQIAASDIQLRLEAGDVQVGETTLLVKVTDKDGNALAQPGKLSVRGDMRHAGMVPVFAEADRATNGVYTLPFEWTMGGAWIVEASLTLASGAVASETFELEIESESGAGMNHKDHGRMDGERDLPGESSAVYMRVTNRGESDRVIVSAESEAAQRVEFHQTLVEDDIARMETIDSLIIPAGETLELQPGGAHIMLTGLNMNLLPDSQIPLRLTSESGTVYDLDVRIANMLMGDLDEAIAIGDLVFGDRWARPAQAGSMSHSDMEIASEGDDASG